jgi:lycopene cyclase domain-containing protein
MTYLGFLARFLLIPMGVLLIAQSWIRSPAASLGARNRAMLLAAGIQVILAVSYTTPWDNYLVATGVWYYNPALVAGVLIGYVPIEEYIFFVLQTCVVVLWWRLASALVRPRSPFLSPGLRLRAGLVALAALVSCVVLLLGDWNRMDYLMLILVWALPPILIQFAFGADILWRYRHLVLAVILPLGAYFSLADALAIRTGTWTISSARSTGLLLGHLPVEEAIFFFATTTMLTFGLTLSLAPESRERVAQIARRIRRLAVTDKATR